MSISAVKSAGTGKAIYGGFHQPMDIAKKAIAALAISIVIGIPAAIWFVDTIQNNKGPLVAFAIAPGTNQTQKVWNGLSEYLTASHSFAEAELYMSKAGFQCRPASADLVLNEGCLSTNRITSGSVCRYDFGSFHIAHRYVVLFLFQDEIGNLKHASLTLTPEGVEIARFNPGASQPYEIPIDARMRPECSKDRPAHPKPKAQG
ncbi:MAG: hypothetical protein QM744_02760 [Mesorhizobium sp.]